MATLTIEDGTGKVDSDAFESVIAVKARLAKQGLDAQSATASDEEIEEAIVRATFYLSNRLNWQGYRRKGRNHSAGAQALAWPRVGVVDDEGSGVDLDVIPEEVLKAHALLVRQELITPGSLSPTFTPGQVKKSVKVGPVGVTYENDRTGPTSTTPIVLAASALVSCFLKPTGQNRLSGASSRV